jgi:hypothetical protein
MSQVEEATKNANKGLFSLISKKIQTISLSRFPICFKNFHLPHEYIHHYQVRTHILLTSRNIDAETKGV